MKYIIFLAIILLVIGGCSTVVDSPGDTSFTTQKLVFNEQDLEQLKMKINGSCQTDDTSSTCFYNRGDSEFMVIINKYTNIEDLNGSYQYDSSHYYSADGLISENTFGDQSRFRVNSEMDYGGELNDPDVYYYHLWITKNLYLIHVTSKGVEEDMPIVAEAGNLILSKFG